MFTRKHLERLISKRTEEVEELQKKSIAADRELAESRSYLQALVDLLKHYPPARSADEQATDSLRAGSLMARARDAIKAAGKPLHITEIMKTLNVESTPKAKTSLAGSLSGYARKSKIFTRPAANTFGLLELQTPELTDEVGPEREEVPTNVVSI